MATGENIGMMEGAFFVGRTEILDWLNSFLGLQLGKIEETCTGAVACQLFDALYPEAKVPMHKIRWDAKSDFEYIGNYKILQAAFSKMGCNKNIVVQELSRGKYQDNLEFMQWFKRFFELNYSGRPYDALAQRSKSRSGRTFKGKGKPPKKKTSRDIRDADRRAAAALRSKKKRVPSQRHVEGKENKQTANRAARSNQGARGRRDDVDERRGGRAPAARTQANAALAKAKEQNAELVLERDFYYGKLRDIEILLQTMNDEETADAPLHPDVKAVSDRILKILYATDETVGGTPTEEEASAPAGPPHAEDAAPALPVADATVAVEAPIE